MDGEGKASRPGGTSLAAAALLVCVAALLAPSAALATLPDGRNWEMVSPPEKNNGEVEGPARLGAGAFQAALDGSALAYASAASFGQAQGAPPVSQYLATRTEAGWSTQNLSPPLLSGTYEADPYLAFSPELSRALLSNGWRCRGGGEECEAENPPLAPAAPPGYRNLYLRQGASYQPLITEANFPPLPAQPAQFHLAFQGADPDLRHIVFATDSGLYRWSEGAIALLSALPGAALAARSGAISADGSRLYFTQEDNLYLREGEATLQIDAGVGGGGTFQTASADGSLAYFSREGHLYRYSASSEAATDLTPTGEAQGVLGASQDGSYLYYLSSTGLWLWHEGTTSKVAAAADASNYPPQTGTARLTPDGTHLAFLSKASLTGYANVGKAEVFLYDALAKQLSCASCNPRGVTPAGPSTIPGALANGPALYKPRALSDDGRRLFFDSADALLFADSDGRPDVYQWEAKGLGSCTKAGGCLALISGGRAGEASFLDASADGSDAFFLTDASLALADQDGLGDVYDARVGGGFPEPSPPIPCQGDACQGPAPAPEEASPQTASFEGPPNPAVSWPKPKPKHHHRKRHRHHHRRHHHHRRQG